MQATDHSSKIDKDRAAPAVVLILLAIALSLFLFWYFFNFEPAPIAEDEAPPSLEVEMSEGASAIVANVEKTERLCNTTLKSFGFDTNQAMDGWYDFDKDGKAVYYAKTKFGNFMIKSTDPDSGEYTLYPQERYIIGNINARVNDATDLRLNKFINQAAINCAMIYVAEQDEKECIYVDVYNNTAYKTTYYIDQHLYMTEELEGQEKEQYAYR